VVTLGRPHNREAPRSGGWCPAPIAPHQLRHAHAVEMAREGAFRSTSSNASGHPDLGITSIYLPGIDNSEIINTVYARPAPMLPASAGLR
jgi:site-specific recombinase XerD